MRSLAGLKKITKLHEGEERTFIVFHKQGKTFEELVATKGTVLVQSAPRTAVLGANYTVANWDEEIDGMLPTDKVYYRLVSRQSYPEISNPSDNDFLEVSPKSRMDPTWEAMRRLRGKVKVHRQQLAYRAQSINPDMTRQPGHVLRLLEEKRAEEDRRMARLIMEPKSPRNHRRHIAVELEFLSEKSRETIGAALVKAKIGRFAQLKGDGSVNDIVENCTGDCKRSCECDMEDACTCECECRGNRRGHELAIVAGERKIQTVVELACKAIVEKGNGITNKTCGLHVHLDMRNHDNVPMAFNNLVALDQLFYSMVPGARKKNQYSKPNKYRTWEQETTRGGERYVGINANAYRKYKTLECRIHSGTLSARKINYWIQLLCLIGYSPLDLTNVNNLTDLIAVTGMKPELQAYCLERLLQFKSHHKDWSFPITNPKRRHAELFSEAAQA